MPTIINSITWTPAAAAWWRMASYGLDADKAALVMETAGRIAAQDERVAICRNDLEAATVRLSA